MRGLWFRAAVLAPMGLAAFSGVAQSDTTLPPRKPGFWQTTMVMHITANGQTPAPPPGTPGSGAPMLLASCIDPTTDLKMMRRVGAMRGDSCRTPEIQGGGGSYTVSTSCTTPNGGTSSFTGTVTYDGDTAMHMRGTMTSGQMNATMTQDAKWVGACPAGVMPGDTGMMRDGTFQKMGNLNNMPQ